MLLDFSEEQKEHLSFLGTLSNEVLQEFCRISLEFIRNGANKKVYQSAAGKLGVDAESIKHGVEGLMFLFIESSKLKLSEIDFQDSVMLLGFGEESRKSLYSVYKEHRAEIRKILSELSMEVPHYHDMEWRYDIQLASRTLRQQINPIITMKLHIKKGTDKIDTHILQTDPTNLVHLTKTLEEALNEMKTAHCRRIVRNM